MNPAFLLTAGVGSRLRPHTDLCPKPNLPFLGLPLSYYSFFLCKQAGFNDFIFNIHHLPKVLRKNIAQLKPMTSSLYVSNEVDQLLGSGGAFWGARKILTQASSFLVANGDEVMIPPNKNILTQLKKTYDKDQPLACLLVTEHPDLLKTLKPVWVNNNNEVVGFGMDQPKVNCRPVHFTGYKIYNSKILDYLPEGPSNIFYDILVERIAQGDKITIHHEKNIPWFETGDFNSYLHAVKECLRLIENKSSQYLEDLFHFYGRDLSQWEIIVNSTHRLFKPKNLVLPADFHWQGIVCLEEGVQLGKAVTMNNTILSRNVRIEDNTKIENTFVFKESKRG